MKPFALYLSLLIGLITGLVTVRLYDRYICPEASFYNRAAAASDAWAAELRAAGKPLIVFAGGSETRAGVNPALLKEEFGVLSVNSAGQAGFGMPANLSLALPYLKEGDTLLFACLGVDDVYTSGAKFAWGRMGSRVFETGMIPCDRETLTKIFCGNSGEFCMHLSKRAVHPLQAPYKYDNVAVIHPSGWMEILASEMQGTPVPTVGRLEGCKLPQLSAAYCRNIRLLKSYCEERGIRLACFLSPFYTSTQDRPLYAWLALQHEEMGVPVLRDSRLGCESDVRLYADTTAHLNRTGVQRHNRILGRALQENQWWSREELVSFLRARGWDERGHWASRVFF